MGVFVPKVGHHVALNNVHSGCHVVVHECENNYPCMAAGGSHYASTPGYLKTILLLLIYLLRNLKEDEAETCIVHCPLQKLSFFNPVG